MKANEIYRPGALDSAPVSGGTRGSPRILVVEDEPLTRQLTSKLLTDAGYRVDAAADGAAAWDTLQKNHFDLLITDNAMPKVSGFELIGKMRAAGIAVPVILASGVLPQGEFSQLPGIQPLATLLKPYTVADFLETVKHLLRVAIPLAMLCLCLPRPLTAEDTKQTPDSSVEPNAVSISINGNCDYSADGVTFSKFERGQIFQQGAIVRTGEKARTDIFFRRTGITIRLQPGTEAKLERMSVTVKDGVPIVHTLLDLRKGRIFTVVCSAIAGDTFEIRNAAGRAVVKGSGVGRYIITADGTHVSAIGSIIPPKVIGENGITVIAAGQEFPKRDGKMLPLVPSAYVNALIQLDELQAANEGISP